MANGAGGLNSGTAHHEAGHAAVGVKLGLKIECIKINNEDEKIAGYCNFAVDPDAVDAAIRGGDLDILKREIAILFAGEIAERKAGSEGLALFVGMLGDLKEAHRLFAMTDQTDKDAFFDEQKNRTNDLLNVPQIWSGVERLAAELDRVGQVEGEVAHRILAGTGVGE